MTVYKTRLYLESKALRELHVNNKTKNKIKMESDEDVLFENSALHQHLISTGVEGFETELHQAKKDENVENVQNISEESDDYIMKYKQLWSECMGFLHLKTILGKMETELNRNVYVRLRNCKTLEPDDLHFLKEFLGPVVSNCSKSGKQVLGLVGVIVFFVTIIIQRILMIPKSWQKIFFADPVVILATCCIMLMIGCSLFLYVKGKKLEEQMDIFIDFLKLLENFQSLLKKSVRLIQECELVARGFTFVTNTGPLSGLEQNTSRKTARQCPELRHQLFHTARDSMMSLRKSNQKLLQKFYPLSPGESTSQYLAFIPLEDYGPCLQITGNSMETLSQLFEATDNFSISSLKAMTNLWSLQQSEFVRCLAICFQSLSSWPSNKSPQISIRRILRQIIQPSMTKLDESSKSLAHYFSFQYASTAQSGGAQVTQPQAVVCNDSPLKGLFVAVHSLDLHLQSALRTSRTLATEIEKAMEGENSSAKVLSSNDWLDQLSVVKAELTACNDCWSEGQIQSDRLFKIEKNISSETHEDSPVLKVSQPETKLLVEIIGEPIIEDEVFEAYVDEEVEDFEYLKWDEFLTPEEKAKKKKEKEEAKRLLSELKSVISGLAEERKRKEESILKAKRGDIEEEELDSSSSMALLHQNFAEAGTGDKTFDEEISLSPDFKASYMKAVETEEFTEPINSELDQGDSFSLLAEPRRSGNSEKPGNLSERLEHYSGADMTFSSNFAAQVMAKSRLFSVQSDTFGDEDSDVDDDNDINDFSDSGKVDKQDK